MIIIGKRYEIETNALTMIVAGSETTVFLLSGPSYHLMMNPEMLDQVTEEVRTGFRTKGKIDCSTVDRL